MNRTLGFERTLKPRDYESVKVSSYISDIPDSVWTREGFIEELGNLLTVQAYKILMNDHILDKELRGSGGEKKELLDNLEKQILETLNLENIILNLNVEIK